MARVRTAIPTDETQRALAATPSADPAAANPDPVTLPSRDAAAAVTPTRVCPRCGAGRMVVVAEFMARLDKGQVPRSK